MFWKVLSTGLVIHGLAHVSGFLAAWTKLDVGYAPRAWVFPGGVRLQSAVGRVFGLLWLVSAVGFIYAGISIATAEFILDGWGLLTAVLSALVSLIVILPWWRTVPRGARFGALFDVLVIVGLLLVFVLLNIYVSYDALHPMPTFPPP